MAILYGLLNRSSSGNREETLHAIALSLKWPGALEHTFRVADLKGGILLHRAFQPRLSDHLYIGKEENILVLVSGCFFNRNALLSMVNLADNDIPNPELVVHLYRQEGKDFIKSVNGDFTILIYQPEASSLLLCRDHLGIRPVSWSTTEDSFWFSSDGIVLSKILGSQRKIHRQYLQRFFEHSDTVNLNLLPDKDVHKLLPGNCLEVHSHKMPVTSRYWFPEKIKENKTLDFVTAKEDIARLVEDAVQIRSDRRLIAGAHLSGGLDSGIVAALVRQNYKHQAVFNGFSWSPAYDEVGDVRDDERKLADETGETCNIRPVYLRYGRQDLASFFSNWKLPGKSVHETVLRKEARREKINLLFSGWGGDEFVSLNNRGVPSDLFFNLEWKLMFSKNSFYRPWHTIRWLMRHVVLPAAGINFSLLKSIDSPYLKSNKPFYRLQASPLYKWKSRRAVHLALLNFGHLGERAEQWFLDGYPEGIEYRYPLLDKRLVEYMLQVPSRILCKKKEYARLMLREVSDGILPDAVTWSNRKSNPALFEKTKRVYAELYTETLPELEEIKKNPDFDFINFEALEKDIAENVDFNDLKEIPEQMIYLLILKHLNTFTKAYYSPFNQNQCAG